MDDIKNKFTKTYVKNKWRVGNCESKSGLGSSLLYAQNFSDNLVKIIKKYDIKTIFDCSCGDWNWMKEIKHEFTNYIGNDIVEPLIRVNNEKYGSDIIKFICSDALTQLNTYDNNKTDLIICRHTLEHLSTNYCIQLVSEIKRVAKYAIITSTNVHNKNNDIIVDGCSGRSINLDIEPFNSILEPPIEKFYDSINEIKEIGCFGHLYHFN